MKIMKNLLSLHIISRLAFGGVGLYEEAFSSGSPELTCEGSFKKCFRKGDKSSGSGV